MSSLAAIDPVVKTDSPEFDPEYTAWLTAIDRGHYADEAPSGDGPERPDWMPEERDAAWWAGESDRLAAESLERQMAASWVLDQIAAHTERFDGRDSEGGDPCW